MEILMFWFIILALGCKPRALEKCRKPFRYVVSAAEK
jgi:hypothetical protein